MQLGEATTLGPDDSNVVHPETVVSDWAEAGSMISEACSQRRRR